MRPVAYLLAGMMALWTLPSTESASGPAGGEGQPLALIHGLLIDGTGARPIEDAAVVIRGGRIAAAGPGSEIEIPGGAEILDVEARAILPGFVNAHVHHGYDAANLRAWAQAGVTTVRDLGTQSRWTSSSGASVFADRDRLNRDSRNARLVAAGPMVTAPGGYGVYAVTSPEDAREKVHRLIDAGAEVIKIAIEDDLEGRRWRLLSREQIAAIVEVAHARGIRVAAHVSRSRHLQMAIDGGVDDVDHMAVDPVPAELLNRMVELGIAWVPTLELWSRVSRRYGLGWDAVAARNLRRFVAAGGMVALGTDFAGFAARFDLGMPITEIRLMRDAGMTAMQIVEAATRNAAIVCGLADELGTIEAGKVADLIVVDGNPLARLDLLESVTVVVHGGVVIRDDGRVK